MSYVEYTRYVSVMPVMFQRVLCGLSGIALHTPMRPAEFTAAWVRGAEACGRGVGCMVWYNIPPM